MYGMWRFMDLHSNFQLNSALVSNRFFLFPSDFFYFSVKSLPLHTPPSLYVFFFPNFSRMMQGLLVNRTFSWTFIL